MCRLAPDLEDILTCISLGVTIITSGNTRCFLASTSDALWPHTSIRKFQIGLLTLYPAEEDPLVICSLETLLIDTICKAETAYEAMPYAWGPLYDKAEI